MTTFEDLVREVKNIIYTYFHDYELLVFAPERTKISRIRAFELAAQNDWIAGMHVLRQPMLTYALMKACRSGALDAVTTLLSWECTTDAIRLAFNIATKYGHTHIMQCISARNHTCIAYHQAQLIAARYSQLQSLQTLHNMGRRNMQDILQTVVIKGDLAILNQVIVWGGQFYHTHLTLAIIHNHPAIVKRLLIIMKHVSYLLNYKVWYTITLTGNPEITQILNEYEDL